jgi:trichohyalin
MKKDSQWLQAGGRSLLEKIRKEREERRKKILEEAIEEERRKKEEEEKKKREEEELKRKEEEERRKREEELNRLKEAVKKAEEERKAMEEKIKEQERMAKEESQKNIIEEKRRIILEELRRKREEEQRRLKQIQEKLQEEIRRKKEKELIKRKEEEERRNIQIELSRIQEQRKSIAKRKSSLIAKITPIEKVISSLLEKDNNLAYELKKIEEKEMQTPFGPEKKFIERKRWSLEEKRRQVEKELLPWLEEKNKIKEAIEKIDIEESNFVLRESRLRERLEEFTRKEQAVKLTKKKKVLEQKIEEIENRFNEIEIEKSKEYEALARIEDELKVILEKERKVEEDKKFIEEEEVDIPEKDLIRIKEERWSLEEKRRQIEKERWELEDKKDIVEKNIEKLETIQQNLQDEKEKILYEIDEIDKRLNPSLKKEPTDNWSDTSNIALDYVAERKITKDNAPGKVLEKKPPVKDYDIIDDSKKNNLNKIEDAKDHKTVLGGSIKQSRGESVTKFDSFGSKDKIEKNLEIGSGEKIEKSEEKKQEERRNDLVNQSTELREDIKATKAGEQSFSGSDLGSNAERDIRGKIISDEEKEEVSKRIQEVKQRLEELKRDMEKKKMEEDIAKREFVEPQGLTEPQNQDNINNTSSVTRDSLDASKSGVASYPAFEKRKSPDSYREPLTSTDLKEDEFGMIQENIKEKLEEIEKKERELQKEILKDSDIENKQEKNIQIPTPPQHDLELVRPVPQKPSAFERYGIRIFIFIFIFLSIIATVWFLYKFLDKRLNIRQIIPPLPEEQQSSQDQNNVKNNATSIEENFLPETNLSTTSGLSTSSNNGGL